jgi:hypothetical protein
MSYSTGFLPIESYRVDPAYYAWLRRLKLPKLKRFRVPFRGPLRYDFDIYIPDP